MCECTLLASGEFSPIRVNNQTLSFVYTDSFGNRHVLIEKFAMTIEMSRAAVAEMREDGKIVGYQFTIT